MSDPAVDHKMPCGHRSKLIGHCVRVCEVNCDVGAPILRCTICGSTNLRKHDFGDDPQGRYYNAKLPNAMKCDSCNHYMPDGGV